MSGRGDRLFMESGQREIYNDLETYSPLKGFEHIDVFILAMGIGFKAGIRTPLKTKDGVIRYESVKENWRFIKAIAIAETKDLAIVGNLRACASIAEEYANTGLRLIQEMVHSTNADELENTIERITIDRHREITEAKKDTSAERAEDDDETRESTE